MSTAVVFREWQARVNVLIAGVNAIANAEERQPDKPLVYSCLSLIGRSYFRRCADAREEKFVLLKKGTLPKGM